MKLIHFIRQFFLVLLSAGLAISSQAQSTDFANMTPDQVANHLESLKPEFAGKDGVAQIALPYYQLLEEQQAFFDFVAPHVGTATLITDHGPMRVSANLAFRGKGDLRDVYYFSGSEHGNRFGAATHIEIQGPDMKKYRFPLVMDNKTKLARTYGETVLGDFVMVRPDMSQPITDGFGSRLSADESAIALAALNALKVEEFTSISTERLVQYFGTTVFALGRAHEGSVRSYTKKYPSWYSQEYIDKIEAASGEAASNADLSNPNKKAHVGDFRFVTVGDIMGNGVTYNTRDMDGHNKDIELSIDAFLASPWDWVVSSIAYNMRMGGRSSGSTIKKLIGGVAYSVALNWTNGIPDVMVLTDEYKEMVRRNPSLVFGRVIPFKMGNEIGLRLGDENGKIIGKIIPAPFAYGSAASVFYHAIVDDIGNHVKAGRMQDANALSALAARFDRNDANIEREIAKKELEIQRLEAIGKRICNSLF